MQPILTKPVILRWLEYLSYSNKFEYQLYDLDQWNSLSISDKEVNVSL